MVKKNVSREHLSPTTKAAGVELPSFNTLAELT